MATPIMNRAQRAARRLEIAAAYAANEAAEDIAQRYGMSVNHVYQVARAAGISRPTGRRAVWPDCPPELEPEYRRLRVTYRYRAATARQMLEAA